jgi:hypothetical protein
MTRQPENGRQPERADPGEQMAKPTHFIDESVSLFILGVLG